VSNVRIVYINEEAWPDVRDVVLDRWPAEPGIVTLYAVGPAEARDTIVDGLTNIFWTRQVTVVDATS
jgi:hypothetical protein